MASSTRLIGRPAAAPASQISEGMQNKVAGLHTLQTTFACSFWEHISSFQVKLRMKKTEFPVFCCVTWPMNLRILKH